MDRLISQRGVIKAKLTRFRDYLEGENLLQSEIEVRLQKFEPILDSFDALQEKIEALSPDESKGLEREVFENAYYNVLAKAKNKLLIKSQGASSNGIRLPILELPKFDGNYEKWFNFRDTFVALVENNTSLEIIQKMYYLRSCLEGEASKLLSSLPNNQDNYHTAWEILTSRYQNTKLIVHKHVEALFRLPEIKYESSVELRNLIDESELHLKSLNNLNIPTENWDVMLIYLLSRKLDNETRNHWETFATKDNLPTYKEFIKYLSDRVQVLEFAGTNERKLIQNKTFPFKYKKETMVSLTPQMIKCISCKGDHKIYNCKKFLTLNVKDRITKIRQLGACLKCLCVGHKLKECKSKYNCRMCDHSSHNTLLHLKKEMDNSKSQDNGAQSTLNNEVLVTNHSMKVANNFVLLSTAIINVLNNDGDLIKGRALLDSAAQSNFITEEFSKRLQLKTKRSNIPIAGIQNKIMNIKNSVNLKIFSSHSPYERDMECLVLKEVTSNLPQISFQRKDVSIPDGLQLADPAFNETGPIDMLIGADIFWDIMKQDQLRIGNSGLVLQRTEFGWLVSGSIVTTNLKRPVKSCHLSLNIIHKQIENFWKLEEFPPVKHQNHEERACEKIFKDTYKRNDDGRFEVSLPQRPCVQQLGETLPMAERRLCNLQRKFSLNPELMKKYNEFMQEYIDLGHMTRCEAPSNKKLYYYLPHHAVLKESSTTTKTRVVFDGSAKSSTGISLNDALMIGPVLQKDLSAQLIFFRKHQYVLTADIEKMYRQILVRPEDRDLQRIVWKNSPEEEIQHYRLNTVTYGLGPSSFLATKCLEQLGNDNATSNYKVSQIIKNNFYMDDLITGDETEESCLLIKKQLMSILATAGMNLRKWRSNSPSLCSEQKNMSDLIISTESNDRKILGLAWNNQQDSFLYTVKVMDKISLSKRQMLSCIASIFDPLGLIGPVTVVAKLMMQRLWQKKIQWDEPIPSEMKRSWEAYVDELPQLNNLKISRKIICQNQINLQLHGFCDSSERAYSACVYMISTNKLGKKYSNLIMSKSRVAPLKSISLPKLELCGAVLLIRLMNYIKEAICIPDIHTTYWCDSQIVLCWIKDQPARWNAFVANRVAEIQESSHPEQWKHVKSEDNAADILSRGASASQLLHSRIWWHGPAWLMLDSALWPNADIVCVDPPEIKASSTLLSAVKQDWDIFCKYSSFSKLQRVTAYIIRFSFNCKNPLQRRNGVLTVNELENSVNKLISRAQSYCFGAEIRALNNGDNVPRNSKLRSLNPFIEKDLMRVGGRLSRSRMIAENQQHPILLPPHHKITELIIRHYHYLNLHAGTQALLALIRMKFWPIKGKNVVKNIIKKCIICYRCNPRPEQQLMADLPAERITECRPFQMTGVDYCGPILIKSGIHRKTHNVKSYICLFICLVSKAVHLEVVLSLNTESFLNALKRFISRRGRPSKMFSDNATNFKSANSELKEIYNFLSTSNDKIDNYLSTLAIQWQFIPPRAPNFGGLWEAGIKSVKHHLKRIASIASLTYEEINTVMCQIESCLNSRPLTPLSNDPYDLNPLTPGHFLIGTSLAAIPEQNLQHISFNRLNNYQKLIQIIQSFWSRWRKEYLAELQTRNKWTNRSQGQLRPGSMVILKEDNVPPCYWRLGRVSAVHPGADGRVRVATIITSQGKIQRAISKLCLLPIEDNMEQKMMTANPPNGPSSEKI